MMKLHLPFASSNRGLSYLLKSAGPLILIGLTIQFARAGEFQRNPNAGPGDVIVQRKLGDNIFGFEVDPNGTEGLLCEAVGNPDGTVTAAVETFSQATGRIIRVLSKTNTQDDFIAWSVAGSIGLFEHEKVKGLFNIKRTFSTINPLAGNQVNGNWTPPIDRKQLLTR